jgi:hypothetical protein
MVEHANLVRVDTKGMVHPVGKTASKVLCSRAGEWRLVETPADLVVMRRDGTASATGRTLRLAGEIHTPAAMCEIVALIGQSQWRGELVLVDHGAVRSIFFEKGSVIGATTNVAGERLGEILYRAGALTREQLEEALEATQAVSRRFGEAIMDLRFQTPEQLFPMMVRQVEEVFYAILQLSSGTFWFFDAFDEKAITYRYDLHVSPLLMEGVQRMDEMRFFREKIPNDQFVPTPTCVVGRKPPEELLRVYAECDGRRSIAEIGRTTGMLEFEVTREVFQLMNAGFVTAASPRPQGTQSIVTIFNRALARIHATCAAAGKVAELRDGLARFATNGWVYDPLFLDAGPLADGTLRPDRVAHNLAAICGDDPDVWLTQLLHEYVGFAMFQAETLLPREVERELRTSVADLMKPVRPVEAASRMSAPPGSSKSAHAVFDLSALRPR